MTRSHTNVGKTETNQAAAYSLAERTAAGQGIYLADNRLGSAAQKKQVDAMVDGKPVQRKNNTGLPDQLKSGIENLSGHSMDNVKVHYNSDKPAQLNAHAYAQGTDIHLASGQEKHLPHEAWHVVQQKQGRVKPTMQMKGRVNVNDDKGLEKEADVMGVASADVRLAPNDYAVSAVSSSNAAVAQGKFFKGYTVMTQAESQLALANLLLILNAGQQQL